MNGNLSKLNETAHPQIKKFLFPAIYVLIMGLAVFYARYEQAVFASSNSTPIYRNLMDYEAYIKRGFCNTNYTNINEFHELEGWYRYETKVKTVVMSPLPDLPKRTLFSPWGNDPEEFTIIIPITMDSQAMSFLESNPTVIPGMFFSVIGENWEVYLNGTLVKSEVCIDEKSDVNGKIKIKENRTWRNAGFYFDRNLIVNGINIVALRIIGDPTYSVTGLYFENHNFIDDYSVI